jgi:hypothetical protein
MSAKAMETDTKNALGVLNDAELNAVNGGSISDTVGAVSVAVGKAVDKLLDVVLPAGISCGGPYYNPCGGPGRGGW